MLVFPLFSCSFRFLVLKTVHLAPQCSRFLDSSFSGAVSFDPVRGRSYNRPVLAALSLPADAEELSDGRGTGDALSSVHHRADAVPLARKVATLRLRPDDFSRVLKEYQTPHESQPCFCLRPCCGLYCCCQFGAGFWCTGADGSGCYRPRCDCAGCCSSPGSSSQDRYH